MRSAAVVALAAPLVSAQLNELAVKAGLKYFGTATDTPYVSNPEYRKILNNKKEFGQLVPSNGQKWFAVEPEQGVFNFTEGEIVTNIAKENGQLLRCHNTVWHSQLAPWVQASTWDKANFTAMLENHITNEVSHWAGQCYAWDVVNEGLNEDGTYRETIFYQILGEDYLKIAFAAAAKADPKAKLYYNDYNLEWPSAKTAGAARIVKLLQGAGIKIDGVGLQAHHVIPRNPTLDEQIAAMKEFEALGVEVAVTELDIRLVLPTNETNLEQQKQAYKNTVGACLQVKACVGVTVWDFYDPYSWVPGVFAGEGAATLYFDDFSKHPAYNGVVEALTNGTSAAKRWMGRFARLL